MSKALRIAHGAFGRVALLDMDCSLVRHAHPHCHVLLKVEGADTQFIVGDRVYPLTDDAAVLVNGWQPHSYVHVSDRPKTLILALYIEPEWLQMFRPGWVASGGPGFFTQPIGEITPRIKSLAMNLAADMMARPECKTAHEQTLSDLMIAVIERFAPWRSLPASIRALTGASAAWSKPCAASSMRAMTSAVGRNRPASRARISSACSNLPSACRQRSISTCCGWSARSTSCSTARRRSAISAPNWASSSPRISPASSATIPASARASSGTSPGSQADIAAQNETGW